MYRTDAKIFSNETRADNRAGIATLRSPVEQQGTAEMYRPHAPSLSTPLMLASSLAVRLFMAEISFW
jgi:hypothetical protein